MVISVIVPVWNQHTLTESFLMQHAALYAGRTDLEFVIVDNGSTDNTPAVIEKWGGYFKRLKVVRLHENKGFGGGNNIGAEHASGGIFVFTQNDVMATGDYITKLSHIMHARNIGNLYGAQLVSCGDGWNTFGDVTVRYLQGWLLAVWREDWKKLGGFDERYYPCDFEDVDLSYTAEQIGFGLVPVRLPIKHKFGGTTSTLDRLKITRKHKEMFAEKWGLQCT